MINAEKILKEALALKPAEKALVIAQLISSLDTPDLAIDQLWAHECEDRIDAYENGRIKKVSFDTVIKKYR